MFVISPKFVILSEAKDLFSHTLLCASVTLW